MVFRVCALGYGAHLGSWTSTIATEASETDLPESIPAPSALLLPSAACKSTVKVSLLQKFAIIPNGYLHLLDVSVMGNPLPQREAQNH